MLLGRVVIDRAAGAILPIVMSGYCVALGSVLPDMLCR